MSDKDGLRAIQQALARGYCSKENEMKVLDSKLILAMALEVEKIIRPEPKPDWISVEKFYDKLEASQVELTSKQAEVLYDNLFDMYDS